MRIVTPEDESSTSDKEFVRGSALVFVSNLVVAGLSFVLMFALARMHSDELWGVVSSMKLILHTITVIVLNGSWLGVVHFVAKHRDKENRTLSLGAALRISIWGGLFVDLLVLIAFIAYRERLEVSFNIVNASVHDIAIAKTSILILIPLHFISLSSINFLLGVKRFRSNAATLAASSIISTAFTLGAAVALPLSSLLLGHIAGAFVGIGGSAYFLRNEVDYLRGLRIAMDPRKWPPQMKAVLLFSVPLAFATLFTQVAELLRLNVAYFQYARGTAEVQLAILNFAILIASAVRLPQQAMAKVILPQISSETSNDEVQYKVDRSLRLMLIVVGPSIFILGMYSQLIVPLIVGLFRIEELGATSKERLIADLLTFFSVSSLFLAAYLVFASISAGIGRADLNLRAELIGLLAFVMGLPYWQDYGVLRAIGRASIVSTGLMLVYMAGKLWHHQIVTRQTLLDMVAVMTLISAVILSRESDAFAEFYQFSTDVEKFGLVILMIPLIVWTSGQSLHDIFALLKGSFRRRSTQFG